MVNGIFNDKTYMALRSGLSGLATRQSVIGNNIANADTPGFTASDVSFEDALQQAVADAGTYSRKGTLGLTTTQAGHISINTTMPGQVQAEVTGQVGGAMRNDGNNVDIEREMSLLAETEIRYTALTQMTATKLAGLKSILRDVR
jgi:flagellar basal-body rod protein FlgB